MSMDVELFNPSLSLYDALITLAQSKAFCHSAKVPLNKSHYFQVSRVAISNGLRLICLGIQEVNRLKKIKVTTHPGTH